MKQLQTQSENKAFGTTHSRAWPEPNVFFQKCSKGAGGAVVSTVTVAGMGAGGAAAAIAAAAAAAAESSADSLIAP